MEAAGRRQGVATLPSDVPVVQYQKAALNHLSNKLKASEAPG